jgi:hypothetical protein
MSDLLERLRRGDAWSLENPDGPEAAREIERLQAVLDAARIESGYHRGKNIVCPCPLCKAVRALDGEVKP